MEPAASRMAMSAPGMARPADSSLDPRRGGDTLPVVLRRERRDAAGRLCHAVHLDEVAAERRHALPKQRLRDGRCAVCEAAQLHGAGMRGGIELDDLAHGRRHQQRMRDRRRAEQSACGAWVELAHDDDPPAGIEPEQRVGGAGDMGDGDGEEARISRGRKPRQPGLVARRAQRQQVAVGQQRALGPPGGARCVDLHHHVAWVDQGFAGRRLPEPVEQERRGQCAAHGKRLRGLHKAGVDEYLRGTGILDDLCPFVLGQPPVERHQHAAGDGHAEQQDEIVVAVLAEIGDAIAAFEAHSEKQRPHRQRPSWQGSVACAPPLEFQCDRLRRERSVAEGHIP